VLLSERYRVLEEVGRGSFASVARAIDERTGDVVAIKAQRAADAQMLWAEVQQLRRLAHPSLPRVIDVGRTDVPWASVAVGSPFFVAEWIAGSQLDALGAMSGDALLATLVALLRDVAGALAVIHAAGLVHHDVAPSNVRWDAGSQRAWLLDLGFADGLAGRRAASRAVSLEINLASGAASIGSAGTTPSWRIARIR
jgi:eukaryotic-like serine/threonine-protein kinase